MPRYRAKVGMNYRPAAGADEKRVEPGDVVADIPEKSVPWLLGQGLIEEVEPKSRAKPKPGGED